MLKVRLLDNDEQCKACSTKMRYHINRTKPDGGYLICSSCRSEKLLEINHIFWELTKSSEIIKVIKYLDLRMSTRQLFEELQIDIEVVSYWNKMLLEAIPYYFETHKQLRGGL